MPTIQNLLNEQDLFFLQMMAELWGVELDSTNVSEAKSVLIETLENKSFLFEMIESLPDNARTAINAILENNGHISWAKFNRDFGEIRMMGPSKRDRERPDLKPISAAEILWYRGLIGRAFLKLKDEPEEYVYIPDEIVQVLQTKTKSKKNNNIFSFPADQVKIKPIEDNILVDTCTFLAALRKGMNEVQTSAHLFEIPYRLLNELLISANIISKDGQVDSDATRGLLETPRAEALRFLFQTWLESDQIDELFCLSDLEFEGKIELNSKQGRKTLLERIFLLDDQVWWDQNSFISDIHQNDPDFLRPAGNFDTWIIKKTNSNEYLRGFQYWDQIEGQFIRFMISGPFHWFGILDFGLSNNAKGQKLFKVSQQGKALWNGGSIISMDQILEKPKITNYGKIKISRNVPLAVRYQISRFCDWEIPRQKEFEYQISIDSLTSVGQYGLKPNHLLTLLQKSIDHNLPPQIPDMLENWEKHGTESILIKESLLRVKNPEIITDLQKNNYVKFFKEIISPTIVILNQGSEEKIRQAILQLGYLSDWKIN